MEIEFRSERVKRAFEEGAIEELLSLVRENSSVVRSEAVIALGFMGDSRVAVHLREIARDRENERPEVRVCALTALERLLDPLGYADFLEDFIEGESRKVENQARKILSRVDPESYSLRLARRGCVDHAAMKIYGTSKEVSAVPLIGQFLIEAAISGQIWRADRWGKVYAGVRALERIGNNDSLRILVELERAIGSQQAPSQEGIVRGRFEKVSGVVETAIERVRAKVTGKGS